MDHCPSDGSILGLEEMIEYYFRIKTLKTFAGKNNKKKITANTLPDSW